MTNYRPIAFRDTVGKVFSSILNERLRDWTEQKKIIEEEQSCFRNDRKAEDNIYVLIELIGRMKKDNKIIYIAFLDIEKAYDSMKRGVVEEMRVSEKPVCKVWVPNSKLSHLIIILAALK